MMVGGVSALLLQMLHPPALAGVWDHSTFRQDMIGRLLSAGVDVFRLNFSHGAQADA